jgi:hypothetical protein
MFNKEIGWYGADWINLAWNEGRWWVGSCECGIEPLGSIKYEEILD